MNQSDDFLEVYSTRDPGEIALIKSILENEGIAYHFQGEEFSHSSFGVVASRLLVPRSEAERVRELLEPVRRGTTSMADTPGFDTRQNSLDAGGGPGGDHGFEQVDPSSSQGSKGRSSTGPYLRGLLFGVVAGLFAAQTLPIPPLFGHGDSPSRETVSEEADGTSSVYEDGKLIRVEWDRDRDEIFERIDQFEDEQLVLSKHDTNSDGFPDAWVKYRDGVLIKEEVDSNHDRHVDQIYHYRNGGLFKGELDRDFDGLTDERQHYEGAGRLVRVEHDWGGDREMDAWDHYADHELRRREMDTDFDGQVDLWIHYKSGEKTSYKADRDREGTVDEWGTYRFEQVRESQVSFRNDDVIDRASEYEIGRKVWESFDRDRDGVMDERVVYDEFGRVVRVDLL